MDFSFVLWLILGTILIDTIVFVYYEDCTKRTMQIWLLVATLFSSTYVVSCAIEFTNAIINQRFLLPSQISIIVSIIMLVAQVVAIVIIENKKAKEEQSVE